MLVEIRVNNNFVFLLIAAICRCPSFQMSHVKWVHVYLSKLWDTYFGEDQYY